MLSPDDQQIVERDRDIPGLGTLLDTDALVHALRTHLPAHGALALEPDYVHYKPHTNCLVAGRVRTAAGELPFYAKAYGADSRIKLKKTRRLQSVSSALGPGTLILEDARIGVYFFPVDHRIKGLRRLADPATEASLLRGLLGPSHEFSDASLRPLRYKPERRFVACLESPTGQKMLLKFFEPARYDAAKQAAQALESQASTGAGRTNYFFDRHNVMGQEWVPGRLLSDVLLAKDKPARDRTAAIERTGTALAELHARSTGALPAQQRDDEKQRLSAQAETIGYLCPATGRQAHELALKSIAALEKLSGDTATLHGDFYDRQVLLADGEPVIIDLDEAMRGHPAVDLGLFAAHLERHGLYDRLSPEEVEDFTSALLRGYDSVRRAPSESAINVYTAIGLFHLAAEPFRYCEAQWRGRVASLLSRVERILARNPGEQPLRCTAV